MLFVKFRFIEKSTEEWEAILEETNIAYGPINNIKQVFEDPQVRLSGLKVRKICYHLPLTPIPWVKIKVGISAEH